MGWSGYICPESMAGHPDNLKYGEIVAAVIPSQEGHDCHHGFMNISGVTK